MGTLSRFGTPHTPMGHDAGRDHPILAIFFGKNEKVVALIFFLSHLPINLFYWLLWLFYWLLWLFLWLNGYFNVHSDYFGVV
jgi:hypothetical protein